MNQRQEPWILTWLEGAINTVLVLSMALLDAARWLARVMVAWLFWGIVMCGVTLLYCAVAFVLRQCGFHPPAPFGAWYSIMAIFLFTLIAGSMAIVLGESSVRGKLAGFFCRRRNGG